MQPPRTNKSGSSSTFDFSKVSFLIVDDQPFTRRIIKSILAGFGSRAIHESASSGEALVLARNVMPTIVITDLVMPVLSGIRLINLLKAPDSSVRHIPIIVLSGYVTRTSMAKITEAGADAVLVKPVAPKALFAHVVRILLRQDQEQDALRVLARNRRRRIQPKPKKISSNTTFID